MNCLVLCGIECLPFDLHAICIPSFEANICLSVYLSVYLHMYSSVGLVGFAFVAGFCMLRIFYV
ncbi:hypothetical protein P168DRAFT_155899 [Aspergillus campestris IBT 28561]|uniref:Uncharacterized protein n=1 Tax=Aspergillus campestris (strain IBT 28561) TaxID=1392248 RepID=A0A2I1D364_ASPC2|nr:uncharacterized protein P168DRAFT_155899 [Aspergillus campestris IBT 28561]PKY04309.1 hypothetical protein P168DRAFT_155899 [Aspergillus campestris IBT 28561]